MGRLFFWYYGESGTSILFDPLKHGSEWLHIRPTKTLVYMLLLEQR